jgi:hypothetical protein
MKKLLLLIGIVLIGAICQAQEKKFKLTPATAKDFDGSLPDKKMIQEMFDTGSVLKSFPANALDDYYNHKLDEMKNQELSSERDRLVRQFEFEQEFNLERETMEQELSLVHEQRLELEREMGYRYNQELTNSIFDASRLVIDAIGGIVGTTIPDYYNHDQYYRVQPFEDHMNEILLNQFLWDRVFPLPSPPRININE